MGLNNFSENLLMQSKQQQNTKESIGLQSETQIETSIKIPQSNENGQFRPKDRYPINENFFNKDQLVSQKMKMNKFSSYDVLGIIMLKIMNYQSIRYGYSSTKLSIIKAINDIESNRIHARYHYLFNTKIFSYQLMTILNKSLKQIYQQLSAIRFDQKFKFRTNNFQNEIENIKIHKIIMNHIKSSLILTQFFHIFFTSLLLLVNYPIEKLKLPDQNAKEILFILCDYLACKIEESSQKFIIDQSHFIKIQDSFIQFGYIQHNKRKEIKIRGDRMLLKNFQTRSTHDLFNGKKSKKQKNTHSTGYKYSPKQLSSNSSKKGLKNSVLFCHQHKLKNSQSKVQILHKENNMNDSYQYNKIKSRKISPLKINQTNKLLLQKNKRVSIGAINPRGSVKVTSLKIIDQLGFKCQKCFMKKQLKFISKVVDLQLK